MRTTTSIWHQYEPNHRREPTFRSPETERRTRRTGDEIWGHLGTRSWRMNKHSSPATETSPRRTIPPNDLSDAKKSEEARRLDLGLRHRWIGLVRERLTKRLRFQQASSDITPGQFCHVNEYPKSLPESYS